MIDPHDLAFIKARAKSPILFAEAAPPGGLGGINPHVSRFWLADGSFMAVIHIKPIYYEHKSGEWRPLREVCAHHGNRHIVLLPDCLERGMSLRFFMWLMKRQQVIGGSLTFGYPNGIYWGAQPKHLAFADTAEFFPDPNPETTSVDGQASDTDASWDTAHDNTTGDTVSDSGTTIEIRANGTTTPTFLIRRLFALFDTSSLDDAATVTAGLFSGYVEGTTNTDNDGDDWANVVSSSPASNTAIVAADYDQCGDSINNPTELATRIDITSIGTGAYKDWALNAAGLAAISLTGITKLGMREGHDALDLPIDNSSNKVNRVTFRSAEDTNLTDPKLTVTYTAAAGDTLMPQIWM